MPRVVYRLNGQEVPREEFKTDWDGDRLQDMLRSGKAPTPNTDNTFLAGHVSGSQFANRPEVGDAYKAMAQAEGVDVHGKVYLSSLAAYPGDPQAWVSGKGDVQRVCTERGWSCEGAVNVQAPRYNQTPPEQVRLAPDIVAQLTDARIAANPDLSRRPRQEIEADVIEAHGART